MAINLTSFVSELAETLTRAGFEATADQHRLTVSGHPMYFSIRGRRRREVYLGYRHVARWGPTLAAQALRDVMSEMADYARMERRRLAIEQAQQIAAAVRPILRGVEATLTAQASGMTLTLQDPLQVLAVAVALGAMTGPGNRHEREAFILGLLDGTCNPLIFADWLDENDDDIAGVIRAVCALLPEGGI